jgi:mannose/cellobiose epimerase-like protein (N-acyl-D-glucosamine 2-epimerase family)
VFGLADSRGWMRGAESACQHGLAGLASMRRADGLYRASGPSAAPVLDGMGLLYDQAFVLLALDTGRRVFADPRYEREAGDLRERLAAFAHPLGGFAEAPGLASPLFSNPNMHLFESCLAWSEVAADPVWRELTDGLARLALDRLIVVANGVLFEAYGADWRAPDSPAMQVIWPGHLYEWSYLLLRWRGGDAAVRRVALRLLEVAERMGVDRDRGVVMFAADGALQPVDRGARLWAQTERLRAVAHAAALMDDPALWAATIQAAATVEAFLVTETPGLWRDRMDETGAFREEPAPASSLYHIVGAIAELEDVVEG